jgi:2-methylcitrate dehydratase
MAAVLAAGESARSPGRLVVLALALAYEIQCRFCDAAALRSRGWDHVTYGAFSTALGVAKVLDLSEAESLQALNLSGVANISLRQTRVGDMSMWKACAFANASRNAVFATLLAKQGMTGPSPIFEGEKGFVKLVSGPLDLALMAGEQRDSGSSFKILDTYIKHYPVEYHAQTAVEAALALRDEMVRTEGPGVLAEISRIVIDSYDVAIEIIGRDPEKWLPRTRETADHSFPYCVAVALLDGDVTVASFDEKRLEDPLVQACMRKVHVRHEPQFETCYPNTMPTRMTIETTGGRTYSRQVDAPLGHPKHQMSDAQLEEKFIRLAGGVLDRDQMKKVIELVWQFDNLKDVGAFISLLQVEG